MLDRQKTLVFVIMALFDLSYLARVALGLTIFNAEYYKPRNMDSIVSWVAVA